MTMARHDDGPPKWSASGTPVCKWLGSHEGIQQHTVLCIYIVFTIETHVYKHDISVYMHPSSCKSFHHFQQKPAHLPYHLFSTGFDFLPHFNLPPRNVGRSCVRWPFLEATVNLTWKSSNFESSDQLSGWYHLWGKPAGFFEVWGSTAVFYIVCLHSIDKLLYVNIHIIYIYIHLYADFRDNFFVTCNSKTVKWSTNLCAHVIAWRGCAQGTGAPRALADGEGYGEWRC